MTELLTVADAADLLRTSPNAIYLMLARGKIPSAVVVRVGRRVLFRRDDLRQHFGLLQDAASNPSVAERR